MARRGNGVGIGGPAQGAGYGGPASGEGSSQPAYRFGRGTNAQGHNQTTPASRNAQAARRQRQGKIEDQLFYLALNAETQRDQIAAGRMFIADRKEIAGADGGPLQVIYSWADEPPNHSG